MLSRQPFLGASGMLEAGPGGHTVPSSRKMQLTLEKSDNELCCEPRLPAVFDGFSENSPFGITPFFSSKQSFQLHTRCIQN